MDICVLVRDGNSCWQLFGEVIFLVCVLLTRIPFSTRFKICSSQTSCALAFEVEFQSEN